MKYEEKIIWIAIAIWVVIQAVFLFFITNYSFIIFPVSSLVLALFLYKQSPPIYIGFAWCLTFGSPLIRKFIDYKLGYLTPGPWDLSARLVGLVAIISIIRHFNYAKRENLVIFLNALCVIYVLLVSIIYGYADLDKLVVECISWLNPILLAFHLSTDWYNYPQYRKVTQSIFIAGLLVMGVYGILQFAVAPPWDQFWINNIDATTFGRPERFGIRVFSTMGSPHEFAIASSSSLLIALNCQSILGLIASVIGSIALLLTKARGPWLGFVVGVAVLFVSLKPRWQLRFTLFLAVMVGIMLPFIFTFDTLLSDISERLDTLSSINDDGSLNARLSGYRNLFDAALVEVIGQGFITPENTLKNDSGIVKTLFSFGWVGILPYISSLLLLLTRIFKGSERFHDSFVTVCNAVIIGVIIQVGLIPIFEGSIGMILWSFIGLRISAHKYHSSTQNMQNQLDLVEI